MADASALLHCCHCGTEAGRLKGHTYNIMLAPQLLTGGHGRLLTADPAPPASFAAGAAPTPVTAATTVVARATIAAAIAAAAPAAAAAVF